MKKQKLFVILLALSLILPTLAGCDDFSGFHYHGEEHELYSAAIYAIPGCSYVFDVGIEIIEKDDYGRVLFSFSARDSVLYSNLGKYVNALMIIQKADDGTVSWYPDACYLFADSLEPSEIEWRSTILKLRNSWDKPLEPERFFTRETVSKRSMCRSNDYHLYKVLSDAPGAFDTLERSVPIYGNDYRWHLYDFDKNGKVIVVWCVNNRFAADPDSPEIYYVQLAHEEEGRTIIDGQLRADSLDELQESIIELRGYGWEYRPV